MAGEKILPFDVSLELSGREILIDAVWPYSELAIQVDNSDNVDILVNSSDVGNLIFEWADNSAFDFGVSFGGGLLFSKIYAVTFDGINYLLGKTNIDKLKSLDFQDGFTQINFQQISNLEIQFLACSLKAAINNDLSKMPANIKDLNNAGISEIRAYTGFNFIDGTDRFILLPIFSYALNEGQIDQLLIDLSNSVWDPVGTKLIDLTGFNAVPSATSAAAILSLQAQGVTVNVNAIYNSYEYYMFNNLFDNVNTANEYEAITGNSNYLDITVNTGGAPIVLNGAWFVEWVENAIASKPTIFGYLDSSFLIKIDSSSYITINANLSGVTTVTIPYTLLPDKLYRLESDGTSKFTLFENGVQVGTVLVGANLPNRFECTLIGAFKIGAAFVTSDATFRYAALGEGITYKNKYLFQEGSGADVYDSIGIHHGLINGTLTWNIGVDTPVAAGTQTALNSWNKPGAVVLAENESNPGFDVLGNPILRPKYTDGYNFTGISGHFFGGAGVFDRTGASTDFYLVKAESLPGEMFIAGDDIFQHSIQASGKWLVKYNGGTMESLGVVPTGEMFLFTFITDGLGRGLIYIGSFDTPTAIENDSIVNNAAPAVAPMQYGNAAIGGANLDGYVGHAAHFTRILTDLELEQVYNYYRRFFIN